MAAFPPMTETHPNGRWLEFVQGSRHHRLERNLADIASHDRTHRAPHFGEAEQEGTLRPFCAKPRLHSHPVPNALLWAFAVDAVGTRHRRTSFRAERQPRGAVA